MTQEGADFWVTLKLSITDTSNLLPRTEARVFLSLGVGADANLSHRADRILSQGWKPTLRSSAVHKYRVRTRSLTSLMG